MSGRLMGTGPRVRRMGVVGMLVLVPLAGLISGCSVFHRTPAPPEVVIPQPPILLPDGFESDAPMPAPMDLAPIDAGPAPEFALGPIAPPPPLPRRVETPGRLATRAVKPTPAPPNAPQLQMSLNAAQQAGYRQNILAVLSRTQGDLHRLYQRSNINSQAAATRAQADEYVHQAQQALAAGDYVRAQTLADKAETLARFLLNQ